MRPFLTSLLVLVVACGSRQASAAGEVDSLPTQKLTRAIAHSDELTTAQAAIDRGHPWLATQILGPMLADPAKRTPAVLIVAARAAAGWEGWSEVDRLLSKEPWVDAQFNGEGRELLTRSALGRGADTAAVTQARAAVHDAKDRATRAVRSVYLGRAFERNNLFDSAAVSYAAAASVLLPVRDWLTLRVAGNEPDSAARAAAFASLTLPAARARIPWTEAQTRERFQDALGASVRFAALGSSIAALRLRLSVAPDSATRGGLKSELLAYIRAHSGTPDAKTAVEVLDKSFTSNLPAEELVVARSAAASGPAPRAVAAFEHAMTQPGLVTAGDRIAYAQALSRVGRSNDALMQLAAVDGPLAGDALYQRARILLTSGTADATRTALRDAITRFPADTSTASAALYLLADLSTDDANDDDARALYRQLYHDYPTSVHAADARFNAAVIDYAHGDTRPAALALDSLVALMPRSDEATAAMYWSGRSWFALGDTSRARARWREIIAQQPMSYYAMLSASRIGVPSWTPPARTDSFPRFVAIDSGIARAALLERLGMDAEARFEYDALDAAASASPDRLIATAHAFLERDQSVRAIRLAQKAIDGGQRDARTYRLLYPLIDRDELTSEAKANGLEPALVAGLIRQESNFNPRAVSAAGARGLMQVLPNVGEEVSHALKYPVWYPALLLEPDANLQLGTAHLAAFMKQYGQLPRVLAAYNAGGSRVSRWVNKPGMDDPELFAERVPFVETRDYVRLVQRNQSMYRNLYKW